MPKRLFNKVAGLHSVIQVFSCETHFLCKTFYVRFSMAKVSRISKDTLDNFPQSWTKWCKPILKIKYNSFLCKMFEKLIFLLFFSFNPFATLVLNFKAILCARPISLKLNQEHSSKKIVFFWSDPYKIEVVISSVIEMLELPNFCHMTTSTI